MKRALGVRRVWGPGRVKWFDDQERQKGAPISRGSQRASPNQMVASNLIIEDPLPEDAGTIASIAKDAGVFTLQELHAVRVELDAFFKPSPRDNFKFIVCRNGNPTAVAGFACFAPDSVADGIWYLWWLCVDPTQQGFGIGQRLLTYVEEEAGRQSARAIYVETSDLDRYRPARSFYEHHGYERVACLADYYGVGDSKVIYRKVFRDS